MGLLGKRTGGRYSRSPFSRPVCDHCGKRTNYGSPSIRIEISEPTEDMNKMIARAVLCRTQCALDWLAEHEVE